MGKVILHRPDSRHAAVMAALVELLDIPDSVTRFEVMWDGERGLRVECEFTPPKVFEPEAEFARRDDQDKRGFKR